MASPGLLFLLLMSSSLLLSTISGRTSPNQRQLEKMSPEKLNKVKERAKEAGKIILKTIDQMRNVVTPFLALIPVNGPLIKDIVNFVMVLVSVITNNFKDNPILDALKYEFEILHSKLDKYHMEQKWETWAAGAFHKPEKNIEVAWNRYEKLVPSLLRARNDNEKKNLREEIINACSKSLTATETLLLYLNARPPTMMNNLGDMLADHVKCHEKDLRKYIVFLITLIYKGNSLNRLYYQLKEIESQDIVRKEAKIAYDSASALFQIQKRCILNSMDYIKKDVKELIDKTKKNQEIANTVRSFLAENYDRYDWMVVAFISKNSQRKHLKTLNRHVLSGFTEVSSGKISVGVARQVKGTHTKAGQVKQAIDRCFDKSVLCYKVAEKLTNCGQIGNGLLVADTYTAVHAFTNNAHDSHGAKEAEDDVYAAPEDPNTPYIYRGKCEKSPGVKGGKFVVMIKSDEEMMTKDPCAKLNCGGDQKGKCVRVKDIFVAMCECLPPYYGPNCEQRLDDYENAFQKDRRPAVRMMDSRRRDQPVRRYGF